MLINFNNLNTILLNKRKYMNKNQLHNINYSRNVHKPPINNLIKLKFLRNRSCHGNQHVHVPLWRHKRSSRDCHLINNSRGMVELNGANAWPDLTENLYYVGWLKKWTFSMNPCQVFGFFFFFASLSKILNATFLRIRVFGNINTINHKLVW